MKKTKDQLVRTEDDLPCRDCINTFRSCPMDMALALSRVPTGMEVTVVNCPERKPGPKD